MSSRGSGLTLMAVVLGLIGYFIFQSALGINTKVDDIPTILLSSSSNSLNISIGFILGVQLQVQLKALVFIVL